VMQISSSGGPSQNSDAEGPRPSSAELLHVPGDRDEGHLIAWLCIFRAPSRQERVGHRQGQGHVHEPPIACRCLFGGQQAEPQSHLPQCRTRHDSRRYEIDMSLSPIV